MRKQPITALYSQSGQDSDNEEGGEYHTTSNASSAVEEGAGNVLLEGIENTSDASCARAFK